jgi:expansin (peptidoglycan-binding protein)
MAVSLLAIFIGIFLSVDVEAQSTEDQFAYLPIVTGGSNEPDPGEIVPFGPVHNGNATYYNVTTNTVVNCGYSPLPNDLMIGAMNEVEYANSAICGAYVSVTGPKGTILIRIVDRCPECPVGHIDLSQVAFAKIAELFQGFVPITWQLVSPPLDGPIVYHYKADSTKWWSAIQIRNHRNPITRLEFMNSSGVFQEIPRAQYNYFEQHNIGEGPFTFRVTDYFGNMIVDSNIPLTPGGDIASHTQFPPPP